MYKVLIVDDEKIVRIALKSIINWNEYGMTVIGGAQDGVSALEMFERHQPDIIITDLKMPNMDGIQLITALNERKFKGKILVLSNYGDFELVRDALKLGAVDYILKVTMKTDEFINILRKITELLAIEREMRDMNLVERAEVNEARRIVRNNFFKDLFTQKAYHYSEMEPEAKKAGIREGIEKSIMLYLLINDYDKAPDDAKFMEKKHLLAFSVQNIIGEVLAGVSGQETIEIDCRKFVVMIPMRAVDTDDKLIDRVIKSITGSVEMYLNIDVSVIISEAFEGFYGARKAFQACEKLSELVFFRGPSSLVKAGEINLKEGALNDKYEESYSALVGFLQMGDLSGFNTKLSEISEFAENNCFPSELKSFLIRLFGDLGRCGFINDQGYSELSEKWMEKIANSNDITGMRVVIEEFVNQMFECIHAFCERQRKEVSKAIEFIKANIARKISLSMIAEHVNMNYSYFCKVFKKETGKSIISYINELKVEKSLDLLKKNNLTIKEIAAYIGFEDQFYFNRIFRKYTGHSPTEYQLKMSGRNS